MNNADLIPKVHNAMYQQCQKRGYAAPVDVLMDIGVLPGNKYEDWRYGRVPYLESVCAVNLSKLSFIMKQMRVYAEKDGLKPSFCYYKQWGTKKKRAEADCAASIQQKRQSGNREKPHYVDLERTAQLKAERAEKQAAASAEQKLTTAADF